MHELSIAIRLVDVAAAHARRVPGARVAAVTVMVGPLAGVAEHALRAAFDAARVDTPLAEADLRVRHLPVRVWCPTCAVEHDLPDLVPLACPACGAATGDLRGGAELDLESLEFVAADVPPGVELSPTGTAAP